MNFRFCMEFHMDCPVVRPSDKVRNYKTGKYKIQKHKKMQKRKRAQKAQKVQKLKKTLGRQLLV